MKVVTVIPLKKGAWGENLTYFTTKDIPNGSIVVIPLRGKKILGLVIYGENVVAQKSNIKGMPFHLKKIIEVKKTSIFLEEYLDVAIQTSKYFIQSKNTGITSLIPASFRHNYDKIEKFMDKESKHLKEHLVKKSIESEKLVLQASTADRISFYKTLIRGSFAEKKSVFMVLPTEHDIKIFKESLSRGIEQFTFELYSGLSEKKIITIFERIMTLNHSVLILGTTPFLSVPRRDIKTIILEHESSNAYRMFVKPYFDLRFFAEFYAAKINAKFILSDTILRFETVKRTQTGNLTPIHPMQYRIDFKGEIEIGNPNEKTEVLPNSIKKSPTFRIFSDKNIKIINYALLNKESIFIFALRKGLATMTVCKDCGDIMSCDKCGSPLVLYSSLKDKKKIFVCNRCERDVDADLVCANCGSWNLMPLGIGIDTIHEELNRLLRGKTKILKLDKESSKTEKGAEKIIKEFEENAGSILIGTEMALLYLKKKVRISIIASFDSLWSIPSFKMSERIIQLVLSIIKNTDEKIIIQTKNNESDVIQAIKSSNLLHFIRGELEDRKKLDYPPYKRFIKITYQGNKIETVKARKLLAEILKEYNPEIFNAFIAKQKEKYVTNALIKMDPEKWSLPEISSKSSIDENLFTKLSSLPPSFQIIVDPEDLL